VPRRLGKSEIVDQLNRDLEAARVAIVALLAVVTDEELRSVETALEALAPMYDAARTALDEIRMAGRHQRLTDGQDRDTCEAIEAHLAKLEKPR
jgi:hypothetical protein